MATVVFNQLAKLLTDYVLGASGTVTPPSAWTMGLAYNSGGVGSGAGITRASTWSVTVAGANINELGSSSANGYSRPTIAKSINTGGVDWGTSTLDTNFATGGALTAADQVTFGPFSSTGPNPNGATLWVLTDGTTINASTNPPYCAADTAATRTFANGDTEKVTATLKAG